MALCTEIGLCTNSRGCHIKHRFRHRKLWPHRTPRIRPSYNAEIVYSTIERSVPEAHMDGASGGAGERSAMQDTVS